MIKNVSSRDQAEANAERVLRVALKNAFCRRKNDRPANYGLIFGLVVVIMLG